MVLKQIKPTYHVIKENRLCSLLQESLIWVRYSLLCFYIQASLFDSCDFDFMILPQYGLFLSTETRISVISQVVSRISHLQYFGGILLCPLYLKEILLTKRNSTMQFHQKPALKSFREVLVVTKFQENQLHHIM